MLSVGTHAHQAARARAPLTRLGESQVFSVESQCSGAAMLTPRFWTVVTNSPSSQSFGRASSTGLPAAVACRTSGYCVDEWLPQMITPCGCTQATEGVQDGTDGHAGGRAHLDGIDGDTRLDRYHRTRTVVIEPR